MAQDIFPAAFVEQYRSNVEHLAARQKHIFEGKGIRIETANGKVDYFDQIGGLKMHKIVGRLADITYDQQEFWRRQVSCSPYGIAVPFDGADKVRGIIDPNAPTAQNQAFAINVSKDEVIVAAALGTAYKKNDDEGSVPVAVELGDDRKVGVGYNGTGNPGANTGLTLAKLIRLKSLISRDDVQNAKKKYFVHNQAMLDQLLLNVQEVKSTDYAAVKALQEGGITHFLGMEWVKYEELPAVNGIRSCFAYCENAILFANQKNTGVRTEIEKIPGKWNAWHVTTQADFGATRMREDWISVGYVDENV